MADRATITGAEAAPPGGRRAGLAVLFVFFPDRQSWCPVSSADFPDPAEDDLVVAFDGALTVALPFDPRPGRPSEKKLFPHLTRKDRPTGLPADAVAVRFAGDGARSAAFATALRALIHSASDRGWRPDDPVLPPLESGAPGEAVAILRADDAQYFQPADEHGIALGWVSVSSAARRRAGEYQRRLVYPGDWDELLDFLGRDPLPIPDAGAGVLDSGEVADRSDPSARQGSEFQQLLRVIGTGPPADRERAARRLSELGPAVDEVPTLVEMATATDQHDAVRTLLLRAVGTALQAAFGGPESVRRVVVPKILDALYKAGPDVRRESVRVLLGVARHDPRLRAVIGELALQVPDAAGGLDQLTVAATRSRDAKAALRERAGAGLDLSQHTLVNQLRSLADETGGGTRGQMVDVFARLEGLSFGSVQANREVAALVRAVLDRFGARLKCVECGRPARLIVKPSDTSVEGLFRFDHGRAKGTRFHAAGPRLPRLELHDES